MANGICIRLYDEKDFAGRPRFTDPEILRSSLAGVILRMKSLHLGAVEDFPFLEAPPRKAIADGYALLAELDAVDDANELTPIGHELARLPLDPRVGRMILEARERQALDEVLIIAVGAERAGRARPPAGAPAGRPTRSTSKFDDEKSEFIGYLKLWKWIEEGRGVHGHAGAAQRHATSCRNRQQEQRLRDSFVSLRRVREWRDIHIAAAHRGGRARLAAERLARHLRADAPVDAGRPAGQHRLQERRRRVVPGRARHQVLAPPRRAPEQEARALDRGGRAGGDHAPVRPRHRRHRAAVDAAASPATC